MTVDPEEALAASPTMTPATCPTCGWEQEPWLARRNPVNYCPDPFHQPQPDLPNALADREGKRR